MAYETDENDDQLEDSFENDSLCYLDMEAVIC